MNFRKWLGSKVSNWVYLVSGAQQKIDGLNKTNQQLESRVLDLSQQLKIKEGETNEALELAAQTEVACSDKLRQAESEYALELQRQIAEITEGYGSVIGEKDTQIRDLIKLQSNNGTGNAYSQLTPDLQKLLHDFTTIPISSILPPLKDRSDTEHHSCMCRPYLSLRNRLVQLPFIDEIKCTGRWNNVRTPLVKHLIRGEIQITFPFDGEGYQTKIKTTGRTTYQQILIAAYVLFLFNRKS